MLPVVNGSWVKRRTNPRISSFIKSRQNGGFFFTDTHMDKKHATMTTEDIDSHKGEQDHILNLLNRKHRDYVFVKGEYQGFFFAKIRVNIENSKY